jgi:hypothetical protein
MHGAGLSQAKLQLGRKLFRWVLGFLAVGSIAVMLGLVDVRNSFLGGVALLVCLKVIEEVGHRWLGQQLRRAKMSGSSD